ncbi:MAG TPA: response regulator, partial [Thermoanaerobaculia bacterium]|nr:response regulator [Thermoanaerobaculia bacterium]
MQEAPDVLVVEDNPDDVELTLRALRRMHLTNPVRVARDGVEALEVLLGDGTTRPPLPRVVLLDLKLPRVGGLEVLARLRQEERTRTLPVVVLTSSREEPDVKQAYALGVNSY